MKILILSSGNHGVITAFVMEQSLALKRKGIEVDLFLIRGKSYVGYLTNLSGLNHKISEFKPDLIHAHYGLTALLANLQRKIPVISTFHGSDIWVFKKNQILSQIAHILSKRSIIVDAKMSKRLSSLKNAIVIPCGVDLGTFFEIEKNIALGEMNLSQSKVNLLFSSNFDYYEKNYPLAQKTMNILGNGFNLIELKNYSRRQVNLLLNACDVALMTSLSEGSPQFIKEAMACNCPIVSTDVGDVSEVISTTEGCYISTSDPEKVAVEIKKALYFSTTKGRTSGRQRIIEMGLDSESIANRIVDVYEKALNY